MKVYGINSGGHLWKPLFTSKALALKHLLKYDASFKKKVSRSRVCGDDAYENKIGQAFVIQTLDVL